MGFARVCSIRDGVNGHGGMAAGFTAVSLYVRGGDASFSDAAVPSVR